MSVMIGDFDGTAAVIEYFFSTRASTGTPTATFTDEAGTGPPVLRVIRTGQDKPVTAVPVVDVNVGMPQIDGNHLVTVNCADDGEYNPGSGVRTFGIYVSNGKVDSVVVTGETLATFSTGRSASLDDIAENLYTDTRYPKYAALIEADFSGSDDEYTVKFLLNGEPITSGITSPTITVLQRSDGATLVSSETLTAISGGWYKYTETSSRLPSGDSALIDVSATYSGGTIKGQRSIVKYA